MPGIPNMNNGNGATAAAAAPEDYYDPDVDLFDLGPSRFDKDVAAIDHRKDAALAGGHGHNQFHAQPPRAAPVARAPVKAENAANAFKWKAFQYQDSDRDVQAEQKEDLHGGQLHRQNRAARGEEVVRGPPRFLAGGGRGGGGGRARYAERWGAAPPVENGTRAGLRPVEGGWPVAKGMAEELGAEMFWDGPIVAEGK